MTDAITLTGLRVRGHHGVYPQERRDGQDFVVDVRLELGLAGAARSDDVADTVHYGMLADELAAVVAGEPVALIETLAQRLADVCLSDPRVDAAEVTVHKPAAPIALAFTDVAVTIRRARSDREARIVPARTDGHAADGHGADRAPNPAPEPRRA